MNQSNNFEDEINLNRIYEKFVTYKTLIITITLFFSIAVGVFTLQIKSQYKSVALIEIGNYETIDGVLNPIESASDLVKNININLIYKNIFGDKNGYQILPIEDSIVQIERKSYSIEENEQSLKKIIDYTINRHKSISDEAINLEIKSLEIENLELELPYLDNKISEIKKIIKADEKNLLILESNPELLSKRATQSPTLNQVIHDYKMQLLDLEKQKETVESTLEKLRNTQYRLAKNQIQNETKIINNITSSELKNQKPLIIVAGVFIGFLISLFISFIIDSFKNRELGDRQ